MGRSSLRVRERIWMKMTTKGGYRSILSALRYVGDTIETQKSMVGVGSQLWHDFL